VVSVEWLILLVLIGAVWAVYVRNTRHAPIEIAVKNWAESRGVFDTRYTVLPAPSALSRQNLPPRVSVKFRKFPEDDLEVAVGTIVGGEFVADQLHPDVVKFPDVFAFEPPTDDRLLQEVAHRLDQITQAPNWIEEYDLDGSGHIDDEEWEILRSRIIEEVKTELAVLDKDAEPGSKIELSSVDQAW